MFVFLAILIFRIKRISAYRIFKANNRRCLDEKGAEVGGLARGLLVKRVFHLDRGSIKRQPFIVVICSRYFAVLFRNRNVCKSPSLKCQRCRPNQFG